MSAFSRYIPGLGQSRDEGVNGVLCSGAKLACLSRLPAPLPGAVVSPSLPCQAALPQQEGSGPCCCPSACDPTGPASSPIAAGGQQRPVLTSPWRVCTRGHSAMCPGGGAKVLPVIACEVSGSLGSPSPGQCPPRVLRRGQGAAPE